MTLKDLFTTYWSQVTLILLAIGYLLKRLLNNKSRKMEINHSLYQQNRILTLKSYFSNYAKAELMWQQLSIYEILEHKMTAKEIRVLDQLKETRGLPQMIRVDNGPEFISFKLDHYCRQNNITLVFIQPGKPTQNAFIERCNGSIRKELLSAYVFQSLSEVRTKVKEWVTDYNEMRPHKALNYRTPRETYIKSITYKNSNLDWTEL